jgi:hypothetical protein
MRSIRRLKNNLKRAKECYKETKNKYWLNEIKWIKESLDDRFKNRRKNEKAYRKAN